MTQQERGPSTVTDTPAPTTPRPTESIDRLRSEANIARYADELAEAHYEDIYAVLDWAEARATPADVDEAVRRDRAAVREALYDIYETDMDEDSDPVSLLDAAFAATPIAATPAERLDAVISALTDEDEIAHGEAWDDVRKQGLGFCAYDDDEWPCRTQQGIDRLLVRLRSPESDR